VTQEGCCGVKKVLGKGKGAGPDLSQIWARSGLALIITQSTR